MERKLIGHIGIDAGMCWIGDPCYIFHKEKLPKELGTSWYGDKDSFCEILKKKEEEAKSREVQFNYDMGHEGLGIITSTGYGDGSYPVYATYNDQGRVSKIEIEFM